MKTADKRMDQIRVGDVVKGWTGGWWRILDIDRHSDGELYMDARNIDNGSPGSIYGYPSERRTCAVGKF